MNLRGATALVTGGGTGLGRAISLALAQEGCDVAIDYPGTDEEETYATAEAAAAFGVRAIAVRADVSEVDQVKRMVAHTLDTFGRIDVLINNAGTTVFVPFQDLDAITEQEWDRIFGVNVKGSFLCAQAVGPIMRRQKSGRIINTGSVSGMWPVGSSIPYSVSKSALLGLTRCLAVALAPDVLVNAVAPGFMPTRWGLNFGPERNSASVDAALTKRPVQVEEVADAVLFLARNDSITGQTLVVDGGALLR